MIVDITEDTDVIFVLDIMANDLGKKSMSLWSLDDNVSTGNKRPSDLLSQDAVGAVESSKMGAQIAITTDGNVAYTSTPALQNEFQSLAEGETVFDTLVYAIRLSSNKLNWATATVEITGKNDVPVLTSTMTHLMAGEQVNRICLIFCMWMICWPDSPMWMSIFHPMKALVVLLS